MPSKSVGHKKSNSVAESANPSPFFIIGAPRSGTTLVERILNRHSKIVIPPETGFFRFLDMLGLLGRQSPSREELLDVVRKYGKERRFPYLGIDAAEAESKLLLDASGYEDIFLNLMDLFRKQKGKQRWGEKTPSHLLYVDSIRAYFPDARFILVVRDGRAAIASQLKHPIWNWDLLTAARRWARDARVMLRVVNRLDQANLVVVRFEDLLESPEQVARSMCEFLGEEFEPAMIDPPKGEQASGLSGEKYYNLPWMKKSTGAIDNSRANAWRAEYSAVDLKLVEKMIGKELSGLGYSLENPAAPAWPLFYIYQEVKNAPKRLRNRLSRIGKYPKQERV